MNSALAPMLNRGEDNKKDPKPGELPMARMKADENRPEVRTHQPSNTGGRAVGCSEKLIEPGNSWFSSK